MKKVTSFVILFILVQVAVFANGDHYDSSGKLMTVVACVAVILIGIAFFLFYLERRISKMEKDFEV